MSGINAIARKIRDDFNCLQFLLSRIEPPDGHCWTPAIGALTWFAGDAVESTRLGGASIYLRRALVDDYDRAQLHVEVRVFWNEPGQPHCLDLLRCILWCEMGPPINFTSRSLLPFSAVFLRADDVGQLYAKVMLLLDPALAAYRRKVADWYRAD